MIFQPLQDAVKHGFRVIATPAPNGGTARQASLLLEGEDEPTMMVTGWSLESALAALSDNYVAVQHARPEPHQTHYLMGAPRPTSSLDEWVVAGGQLGFFSTRAGRSVDCVVANQRGRKINVVSGANLNLALLYAGTIIEPLLPLLTMAEAEVEGSAVTV